MEQPTRVPKRSILASRRDAELERESPPLKKRRRGIRWAPEEDLVKVQVVESFVQGAPKPLPKKNNVPAARMPATTVWREPPLLAISSPPFKRGMGSAETAVQRTRESTALKVSYPRPDSIPPRPAEPADDQIVDPRNDNVRVISFDGPAPTPESLKPFVEKKVEDASSAGSSAALRGDTSNVAGAKTAGGLLDVLNLLSSKAQRPPDATRAPERVPSTTPSPAEAESLLNALLQGGLLTSLAGVVSQSNANNSTSIENKEPYVPNPRTFPGFDASRNGGREPADSRGAERPHSRFNAPPAPAQHQSQQHQPQQQQQQQQQQHPIPPPDRRFAPDGGGGAGWPRGHLPPEPSQRAYPPSASRQGMPQSFPQQRPPDIRYGPDGHGHPPQQQPPPHWMNRDGPHEAPRGTAPDRYEGPGQRPGLRPETGPGPGPGPGPQGDHVYDRGPPPPRAFESGMRRPEHDGPSRPAYGYEDDRRGAPGPVPGGPHGLEPHAGAPRGPVGYGPGPEPSPGYNGPRDMRNSGPPPRDWMPPQRDWPPPPPPQHHQPPPPIRYAPPPPESYDRAPPPAGAPPAADANWICPNCGNVNYPSRMKCNRRTCGLPRPPNLVQNTLNVDRERERPWQQNPPQQQQHPPQQPPPRAPDAERPSDHGRRCMFFNSRVGCKSGSNCRYVHDPSYRPSQEEFERLSGRR